MDFEDTFPSAPVRYAFDNDDSDAENEEQPKVCSIDVSLTGTLPTNITLVIGVHGPGSVYLEALQPSAQPVGHINDAPILQLEDDVVYIPLKKTVEREQAPAMARTILGLGKLKSVVILDGIAGVDYISSTRDIIPPFLRVLQSSATKSSVGDALEPPNMIHDLTAALISHCEVHGIPGYALLSLQESYLGKHTVTFETLDAYVDGLKKLGLARLVYNKSKVRIDEQPQHRLYL